MTVDVTKYEVSLEEASRVLPDLPLLARLVPSVLVSAVRGSLDVGRQRAPARSKERGQTKDFLVNRAAWSARTIQIGFSATLHVNEVLNM